MKNKGYVLCCCVLILPISAFADLQNSACSSNSSLINFLDRPSKADSVCTAPSNSVITEMGYQYGWLTDTGNFQGFPQSEIRIGLPKDTELYVLPPNYYLESVRPHAGFTATTMGVKHMFSYNDKAVWAGEAQVTPTSGSAAFGSAAWGAAVNGLLGYNFTNSVSATFELGVSTQALPSSSDGERYNSINPDTVLSWQPNTDFELYGELYGQTKVSPSQGAGADFDSGVLYLLARNVSVDAEVGQALAGQLGGYKHYVGCGLSWIMY